MLAETLPVLQRSMPANMARLDLPAEKYQQKSTLFLRNLSEKELGLSSANPSLFCRTQKQLASSCIHTQQDRSSRRGIVPCVALQSAAMGMVSAKVGSV